MSGWSALRCRDRFALCLSVRSSTLLMHRSLGGATATLSPACRLSCPQRRRQPALPGYAVERPARRRPGQPGWFIARGKAHAVVHKFHTSFGQVTITTAGTATRTPALRDMASTLSTENLERRTTEADLRRKT